MGDGPEVLSAPLGDCLVLAHAGPQPGRRLWVLDPLAAWIWRGHRAGLPAIQIAAELGTRFALAQDRALRDVCAVIETWRRDTASVTSGVYRDDARVKLLECRAPVSETTTWTLRLADQRIDLGVDDPGLAKRMAPWLDHLTTDIPLAPDRRVHLAGNEMAWHLSVDNAALITGRGRDAALVRTRSALVELGCGARDRLLVLHAAGISHAGQGILLIGAGGVGKSTLATALNAAGWALLSDDTVPVTREGRLLGLGLGPCLKAGSWPVLNTWLPELEETPVITRMGQSVRLPPAGPIELGPLPVGAFLIPQYRPGHAPVMREVSPVALLRAMLEAEAVLPYLNQARLDTLVRWVTTAPGFALTYPDLTTGVELMRSIPGRMGECRRVTESLARIADAIA